MKGLLTSGLLMCLAVTGYAQQKDDSSNSVEWLRKEYFKERFKIPDSLNIMEEPQITLPDDFYPRVTGRQGIMTNPKNKMLVIQPRSEPFMPVSVPDPYDRFYLLNLDPVKPATGE